MRTTENSGKGNFAQRLRNIAKGGWMDRSCSRQRRISVCRWRGAAVSGLSIEPLNGSMTAKPRLRANMSKAGRAAEDN